MLAESAVDAILGRPQTFGLDLVLVPAARRLLSAGESRSRALERLRTACLAHLHARIGELLAPPADWRRESTVRCRCARCVGLARFLADPAEATWRFKAVETERGHVEDTIRQARCDVDAVTDRRGRPYTLVCTKNQASYERRATQRARDLQDVARLTI